MKPQEILEKIQSEQYNGIAPNQEELLNHYIDILLKTDEYNLNKERQDEIIAKYRFVATILPTKFQDISSYYIIRERFAGFEEIINNGIIKHSDDVLFRNKDMPVFGTIRMPRFNAFITPTDNRKDALIVFSESLLTFAGIISKCVSLTMPYVEAEDDINNFYTDIESIKAYLLVDKTAVAHFLDLMFSYMLTFEPYYAKMFFINYKVAPLASVLCRGFETFIAGHEYAHHLFGHIGVKNYIELEDENCNMGNYQDELEADMIGAKIAINRLVLDNNDKELSLAGIYLGLKSIELLDRIYNLRNNRDENFVFNKTHPPANIRQKEFIKNEVVNNELAVSMIESIDFIIDYMWREFKLLFRYFNKIIGNEFWITDDIEGTLKNIKEVIYKNPLFYK